MRYTAQNNEGALFWADNGVGYVVSGGSDRDRPDPGWRGWFMIRSRKNGG